MLEAESLVWAKVRGYPWWPGRIRRLDDVPKELADNLKQSAKRESTLPVFFFGSHD